MIVKWTPPSLDKVSRGQAQAAMTSMRAIYIVAFETQFRCCPDADWAVKFAFCFRGFA